MNIRASIALALLAVCGLSSSASAADQGSATIPVNIHVEPFYEVTYQPFTATLIFKGEKQPDGSMAAMGVVFPAATSTPNTLAGKLTCNKPVNLTWTIAKPSSADAGSTWSVRTQAPWAAGIFNNLGTITIDVKGLLNNGQRTYGIQSAGYTTPVPADTAVLTLQVSIVNP